MKKTLRISISILLLALAVAVTQIPVDEVMADSKDVSSEQDFLMDGTVVVKYTGTAKVVSVPAYVTEIGEEAFVGNTEIESVKFTGDELEKISYRAFSDCDNLTNVTIPDSVETVGNGAFSSCASLKSVVIGKNVKDIGIGAFADCPLLTDLKVSGNNYFTMRDDCLYDDEIKKLYLVMPGREKDSYMMPATIEGIDAYAFWGSKNIKTVGLSSRLEEIPDYAFSNCKELQEINLPFSIKQIGIKAFSDCVQLHRVSIPASVISIHETAFDGCIRLEILAEEGTYPYRYYQDWLLRNSVIGEEEVEEEIVLPTLPDIEVVLPEKETGDLLGSSHVVANRAVVFIDNINVKEGPSTLEDEPGEDKENSDEQENGQPVDKGKDIPKYTVTDTGILADYVFYKSEDMLNYSIPEDVKAIGEFSFSRSNLTKAELSMNVEEIGYAAFYHCDQLGQVRIPPSVKKIAPKAFEKTAWMENWLLSGEEDFLIVGDGILLAYKGNEESVTIPDGVKNIGPEAFMGNTLIKEVVLPDSVTEISEAAFKDCKNLSKISGGNELKKIADRAFHGCNLSEVHIGSKVEQIGIDAISASVLVFEETDSLPAPSHEKSSQRITAQEEGLKYLGDTAYVIVAGKKASDLSEADLKGTILDADIAGFSGFILVLDEEDKEAKIVTATLTKEEFAAGSFPEFITVNENRYTVSNLQTFEDFEDTEPHASGVTVKNNSGQVKNVAIKVRNVAAFTFTVKDTKDFKTINEAYKKIYRMEIPGNVMALDLDLVNTNTGIPITRFGNNEAEISFAVPREFQNSELRILALDANGQLENIEYSRDGEQVTMEVEHLSTYVLHTTGRDESLYAQSGIHNNQAVITQMHKLDDSPDTGDGLHPKYFFALGLFGLSIATFFWKKRY